tara:strand:- start:207 stop:524 length:318 start_codon:yes stop_codon:yes gene_type:complete
MKMKNNGRKKLMICDQCGNTKVQECGSRNSGLDKLALCWECGYENTPYHFENTFNDIRGKKNAYLIMEERIENKKREGRIMKFCKRCASNIEDEGGCADCWSEEK